MAKKPRDKWAMKSAMFTRDLPTSEISESYNGIQVLFEELLLLLLLFNKY
jgi:hypothetical protein